MTDYQASTTIDRDDHNELTLAIKEYGESSFLLEINTRSELNVPFRTDDIKDLQEIHRFLHEYLLRAVRIPEELLSDDK